MSKSPVSVNSSSCSGDVPIAEIDLDGLEGDVSLRSLKTSCGQHGNPFGDVPITATGLKSQPVLLGFCLLTPLAKRLGRNNRWLWNKGPAVFSHDFQVLRKSNERLGYSLVFLAGLMDLALLHEILKFLVGAQSQHFLAAAGNISSPKTRMHQKEKRFEFV